MLFLKHAITCTDLYVHLHLDTCSGYCINVCTEHQTKVLLQLYLIDYEQCLLFHKKRSTTHSCVDQNTCYAQKVKMIHVHVFLNTEKANNCTCRKHEEFSKCLANILTCKPIQKPTIHVHAFYLSSTLTQTVHHDLINITSEIRV